MLRLLVVAVLAWLLWRELRPSTADGAVRAAVGDVRARLAAWSTDPEVRTAHAALDAAPSDTVRDWLRALRAAGVGVTYEAPLAPVAVAVAPLADPFGGWRVLAATPSGRPLSLADASGPIDSLRTDGAGASVVARSLRGPVRLAVGGTVARTHVGDSLRLRGVLVLARAGWESKFAIAALEERGWTVQARLAVAPGVIVAQGDAPALDTARLAAVVALDTTAAPYASRIARYVQEGGGLVLGAGALGVPALARLAPARAGDPLVRDPTLLASADPRDGIPLRPLVSLAPAAIVLEERGGRVAAAAHRVGGGRVVLLGYTDTWHWRMAGPDDAPDAHRRWWAGVLAAAAYAPPVPDSGAPPRALDDAPVARLIAALGPPAAGPPRAIAATAPHTPPSWWFFPLLVVALLAEWASRRARGRR